MHDVIIWATFLGAWLLVVGPLQQGAVELHELDFDREGIEGVKATAIQAAPAPPSPWWWLLPPVLYLLHRRWSRKFRQVTLAKLTQTQREQLTVFRSKSTGWFAVAAGGTLLAAGETWAVTEHYDWPGWLFWLIFVIMLAGSVLNTAVRRIRDDQSLEFAGSATKAEPATAADPG